MLPRPDHPEASKLFSNRALCYKNLSDHEGVIRDCTEALRLDKSNWKAAVRRGYAYQAVEKFALAVEDLNAGDAVCS